MSEMKELLRRAAEGFELPPKVAERARRRAARRRNRRRASAALLAIMVSVATVWGLSIAFRRSSAAVPTESCPRAWTALQAPKLSGPGGFSSVVAVRPNDVWAVGPGEGAADEMSLQGSRPVVAHWDGTRWSAMRAPSPPGPGLSELVGIDASAPHDVWAVGDADTGRLNSAGGAIVHVLVEHWNGSAWRIVPAPDLSASAENQLRDVAVIAPNDVWAVGFGMAGNAAVPLIEHWDGSSWVIVPSPDVITPNGGAVLSGVAAVGPTDVWAVGSAGAGTLTEHWDGKRWEVVSSRSVGSPPQGSSLLQSVQAVSSTDVWAVGNSISSGQSASSGTGPPALAVTTLVEHWDGTSWTIIPSPRVSDEARFFTYIAAAGPGDLWAVGGHRPTGDVRGLQTTTLIEHWDGSTWRVVSSPDKAEHAELLGVAALGTGEVWAVGRRVTSQTGDGEFRGVDPMIDYGRCP
jgi:hypothetical protein